MSDYVSEAALLEAGSSEVRRELHGLMETVHDYGRACSASPFDATEETARVLAGVRRMAERLIGATVEYMRPTGEVPHG